ncbi:hypothetical protein [Bacillus xiamenensis]|uniref:hypothetical protein n=1 Tax=Bacillus xiamenensis TaxID=1178537 RepID=UPI0002EF2A36|nr:hypothetical protein [Bacillus xiamenensis]MCW1835471.1 hypothetical protein [Bacillus xiamenensis]
MNIEHPIVTQINDFGYPKSYWPYENEIKRYGYQVDGDDNEEGVDDDETSVDV